MAVGLVLAVAGTLGLTGNPAKRDVRSAHAGPREVSAPAVGSTCPIPRRYAQAFTEASRRTGVPLRMLVAVAGEESRMRQSALSTAGARGLLQIMPGTARELRLDASSAGPNVLAGARYLRLMQRRFGDLDLALSAYHAGPTAVARHGRAPRSGTVTYVENVKARAAALPGCA